MEKNIIIAENLNEPLSIEEIKITEKLISKIKANDHEKAKCLLDECLHKGIVHLDIYDVEHCLSGENEIVYLEFNSIEEAVDYFSNRRKLNGLLVVISQDDDGIEMIELAEILNSISKAAGLDDDAIMLHQEVSKSPATIFVKNVLIDD